MDVNVTINEIVINCIWIDVDDGEMAGMFADYRRLLILGIGIWARKILVDRICWM